jgi:Ca2+-binding EF-hand superfamily protein
MAFEHQKLSMYLFGSLIIAGAGALALSTPLSAGDYPATFEALDADGDGYISSKEAASRKDIDERWVIIDKNADGRLDITEFSAFESEGRFTPPEESEDAGIGAAPY